MRALAPIVVVSLFIAAVTFEGCGKPPCTAANCKTGCCDAMGTCQAGNTNVACGANGAMCSMCTLAQTCAAGLNQCVLASSTGGGGGQGGGTGGGTGGGGGGGGGSLPPNTCNTSGVAMGCMANGPFSCAAATNCFATLADCANSGQCPAGTTGGGGGATGGGGGSVPANSCNTSGVAMGCPANGPFSCAAATSCFATLADCANSGQCPPGGTGGGGGPTTSCNTTGVADGCMSNAPFSCPASNMCYPTLDACVQSGTCP